MQKRAIYRRFLNTSHSVLSLAFIFLLSSACSGEDGPLLGLNQNNTVPEEVIFSGATEADAAIDATTVADAGETESTPICQEDCAAIITESVCIAAVCDPDSGECVEQTLSDLVCDDGDDCTDNDICTNGSCAGTTITDCTSCSPL